MPPEGPIEAPGGSLESSTQIGRKRHMNDAFEILDHQPTLWPRWQLGRDELGKETEEQHWFLFERAGYDGQLGYARAACQYLPGREWVGRAPRAWSPEPAEATRLCPDCMEVSLQYGLRCAQPDS